MSKEFIIHSCHMDGRSVKVNEMLDEFRTQNQDNSAYAPVIRFSNDCLCSKNIISFLCKIKDLCPVAVFETIFSNDSVNPIIQINSILNYLNGCPKINNRFVLKILGTDERQRKERFDGKAHGLSDISKMFSKQPINKKKPILEIDATVGLDTDKLSSLFSPDKFLFSFVHHPSDIEIPEETVLSKNLILSGFSKEPAEPGRCI